MTYYTCSSITKKSNNKANFRRTVYFNNNASNKKEQTEDLMMKIEITQSLIKYYNK